MQPRKQRGRHSSGLAKLDLWFPTSTSALTVSKPSTSKFSRMQHHSATSTCLSCHWSPNEKLWKPRPRYPSFEDRTSRYWPCSGNRRNRTVPSRLPLIPPESGEPRHRCDQQTRAWPTPLKAPSAADPCALALTRCGAKVAAVCPDMSIGTYYPVVHRAPGRSSMTAAITRFGMCSALTPLVRHARPNTCYDGGRRALRWSRPQFA